MFSPQLFGLEVSLFVQKVSVLSRVELAPKPEGEK